MHSAFLLVLEERRRLVKEAQALRIEFRRVRRLLRADLSQYKSNWRRAPKLNNCGQLLPERGPTVDDAASAQNETV
jgi:hypothetical protein